MKRIHIIGRKNSGKTTLIVELVSELTRRGYLVGTIKHTHHRHELDTPGKDSFLHRQAGSMAVGMLTPGMNAVFWPQDVACSGTDRYQQFDSIMKNCDIVLVEGDSQTSAPKIEVFRATDGVTPIAAEDTSIMAVVTDDLVDCAKPIWKRSAVNTIIDNLEMLFSLSVSGQSTIEATE